MQEAAATFQSWLALRGRSMEQILSDLAFPPTAIKSQARYIHCAGLFRIYDQHIHPARFYFDADGGFVLIYLEYPATQYPDLTPEVLRSLLGERAAAAWPSRADDDHQQYIYPQQGVAFSAGYDEVSFIEIFLPTSLDHYREQFYLDPTLLGDEG
ncbi:MAG: hypothetical protein HGA65_02500 [Oscillochloris sp.]|nr:hypothetical protein [Oscillochloris sp.]